MWYYKNQCYFSMGVPYSDDMNMSGKCSVEGHETLEYEYEPSDIIWYFYNRPEHGNKFIYQFGEWGPISEMTNERYYDGVDFWLWEKPAGHCEVCESFEGWYTTDIALEPSDSDDDMIIVGGDPATWGPVAMESGDMIVGGDPSTWSPSAAGTGEIILGGDPSSLGPAYYDYYGMSSGYYSYTSEPVMTSSEMIVGGDPSTWGPAYYDSYSGYSSGYSSYGSYGSYSTSGSDTFSYSFEGDASNLDLSDLPADI